jgi:hypothetical protein
MSRNKMESRKRTNEVEGDAMTTPGEAPADLYRVKERYRRRRRRRMSKRSVQGRGRQEEEQKLTSQHSQTPSAPLPSSAS